MGEVKELLFFTIKLPCRKINILTNTSYVVNTLINTFIALEMWVSNVNKKKKLLTDGGLIPT